MDRIKYHIATLLAVVLAAFSSVSANATNSSPQLHCIAVDSVGDVTLTWTIPGDTNSPTFFSYDIYTSNAYVGPYSLKTSVTNIKQNSIYLGPTTAGAAPVYFYIVTKSSSGNSQALDSLESIYLNINNLVSKSVLKWNAMHTPNIPSFNGWYKIYREYPQYVWTLIDSTQSLTYTDTIWFCKVHLNYKIVAEDASGCQSVSNISGGNFSNGNVPPTPVLDTTSVNGNTVQVSWNVNSYNDVVGYVIYIFQGGIWVPVDTVWGQNNTSYNYTAGFPGSGSVSVEVAALDSCGNLSTKSAAQRSIYLKEAPDKCAHENVLSWDSCDNLLPGVAEYQVFASINGGNYKKIGVTYSSKNTTFTDTGLSTPETICYFIRVVDAITKVTMSSNIVCYTITLPPPPKFAYLRDATVIGPSTKVQVDAYVDTNAGVADYIFVRNPGPGTKGKTAIVGTMPAPVPRAQFISFIDPSADPNTESYAYYIVLQDSCNYFIDTTNIGQTMYLTAMGNNSGLDTVTWNDYQVWKGGVVKYDIYRNEDGGPFSLIKSVGFTNAGSNTYIDNVSSIITGQGVFGYYVQAVEGANGYPFTDTSTSNIAYAYQDPRIYVPNAFNPKGINRVFIPVGVFVDLASYDFTVFDRWGQLLFETTDPTQGWDGTYKGGLVKEDVYVYRIQYTSNKGEYFDKKGTVMMLK